MLYLNWICSILNFQMNSKSFGRACGVKYSPRDNLCLTNTHLQASQFPSQNVNVCNKLQSEKIKSM